MITFLKRLLWDESAAERYGRAALGLFAYLVLTGAIVLPEPWGKLAGGGAMFGSTLIPAGQKNLKPAPRGSSLGTAGRPRAPVAGP